ncbi:MAG TPA: transglycosylase SLT domain-containing protein, partial [Anaeromyxobacteraceae bacterium]|nr:transglycosylase SLT domain-containing protein [Anaeromyxobacteraceae bacterium]
APPAADVARRAEGLVELNRSGEAIALLEPLVREAPAAAAAEPFACRVRGALGRALRRDRQNARAADLLRPVAERCADPALRARALYVLATAVSAKGEREEAIALFRRFAREQPQSQLADDALFAEADLEARAGRTAEAREALAALVRDHPDGDRRDEARFKLAWLERRAGDAAAATAALLAIEEEARDVDAYEHARAAYWRARLLAAQGEEGQAAARAIWRQLVEDAPADYYALLARARLAGEGGVALPAPAAPGPAAPAVGALDPGPLRDDPHYRSGLALLRSGLPRAAAQELGAVDRSRIGGGRGDPAPPLLLLAELLDRAGDHRDAHQLLRVEARAALRRPPLGADRRIWEVAYPPAHADLVRRLAPPAGVPAELLQALMREESALDPEAVSAAGAVGLTQLMLPTARSVAHKLKLPRPDRAALMVPSTSIQIGSAYLGELLRAFDGSAALALAAYNAGAAAVTRWRAAGAGLELDELVEEIPYDETRGYVKRVLRSYASYRLLSGGAAAASAGAGPARASPGG